MLPSQCRSLLKTRGDGVVLCCIGTKEGSVSLISLISQRNSQTFVDFISRSFLLTWSCLLMAVGLSGSLELRSVVRGDVVAPIRWQTVECPNDDGSCACLRAWCTSFLHIYGVIYCKPSCFAYRFSTWNKKKKRSFVIEAQRNNIKYDLPSDKGQKVQVLAHDLKPSADRCMVI